MKISKKLLTTILVIITIVLFIATNFSRVYAEYGLSKWNTGTDWAGRKYSTYYYGKNQWGTQYDWRISWPLVLGGWDYGMHCNFACFAFNNIYCIQKGYAYQHDGFNIIYGIEIDGFDATSYYLNWDNPVATWSCEENNIMAGIVSADQNYGYSNGIRINGDYSSGAESDVQKGIYAYWQTFENALNSNLGSTIDWRI